MPDKWSFWILALFHSFVTVLSAKRCDQGYEFVGRKCKDLDECEYNPPYGPCGDNTRCLNTDGSFYCLCVDGYQTRTRRSNFTLGSHENCEDINECFYNAQICGSNAKCNNTVPHYDCTCDPGFVSPTKEKIIHRGENVSCSDINECQENVCGLNAKCINTKGSYYCICEAGFGLKSRKSNFTGNQEQCEDICGLDQTMCRNGTCHTEAGRGHYCICHRGFSNYGNIKSHCTELNCDVFRDVNSFSQNFHIVQDQVMELNKSCLDLASSNNSKKLNGEDLLKVLLYMIDKLLSGGFLSDNRKVSSFLDLVESILAMIGPLIKTPGTKTSSSHTELELLTFEGSVLPSGGRTLSSQHAQLDIELEVAAGDASSYPGFTTMSLLSYSNLDEYTDGFFSGIKPQENQRYTINSKVVTVIVSNKNTSHLQEPIRLTLHHLQQLNQTSRDCVFWDSSNGDGAWSTRGCSVVESTPDYTVCSCNHLSSFAVLMALYEIEDKFALQLITWVGLSLSLVCLLICILTFSTIRSIQSPRTTIHLHLCISLFIAILIFLAGISQTENKKGCAVVAGMLHFFYLSAFCWMCLEGIQLFRMVVLVFNTNFKTLYMMAGGYGVPAVIVAISAIVNSKGYGTERYCWLKLDFIWSFFGPACVIILVNIFFFLITVWKLAQKFSSLNPDLDNLQKIRAFIITAVAQLCLLGTMWIFGCFQFEKGTIAMSYLFTIFGSFQGAFLFIMHCLVSKQVREEYGNILSRLLAPRKKRYSEFNSSNSSKAHASKSTQDTGESHI
ncbi:adhesion G protein-coupled receptor E5 [Cololabis saira]|uniref:adhesion G protein-coupled receptor E5 n=1 Tax=Cololabis saira TaxID=129043 RepID=UPI002AD1EAA1|nr:adhesion G protein-coupled receptor E5 [Cololabis saira]